MANGALGLREALAHSSEALASALGRADKYRKESAAQAQSLALLQQESRAREDALDGRLREAESRASAAGAKAELGLEKLKAAEARIEELNSQLQGAQGEVRAALERAAAEEKATAEARSEKAGAVAYADEASARAEEAEHRAWEAESRATGAEARATEAEARAKEAEARAKESEAKAQRVEAEMGQAISGFKVSPEFRQEVLEASLDAYVQGFESCKIKVSAALKIDAGELEGIHPGESDEEPAREEKDGGGPSRGDA